MEGWPELGARDTEALLEPWLRCPSPADYVALQRRVDMPRLVEALDDWGAVRLGALGPVREDAAEVLVRKRAAFLLMATERYGPVHAEVFALFVLHSAHDDEVEALLRLLARDKRLGQTLALMPTVRAELEARGLPLSAYPERGERAGDVPRGLARAARDALSTIPMSDGLRYVELSARWAQLPAPYREAAYEVERALTLRHLAPGRVVVGSFDAVTFGVPLGFYYLAAGTGQGLASLARGEYERATRELAPAALAVTLYAGGRGVRALGELGVSHLDALQVLGRQWGTLLGGDGVKVLLEEIRARREAAYFVAEGGMEAALALREGRGDVARAQAWLSQQKPQRTGPSAGKGGAGSGPTHLAALVDEGAGLTREVVEARLALVERETVGPRLSRDVAVLERQRPTLEAPPAGAEGNPRWGEYVAYREKRLGELRQGLASEGPLRWEAYEVMRGWFARGLAFEHRMVELLRADAALPREARRFLGDFHQPRVERSVGVWKPGSGLRYADVLVVEQRLLPGQMPRVETFSFKSRNFLGIEGDSLKAQMLADAREAVGYYGETLDIRRSSLQPLLPKGREVPVSRVRLIYEGGALMPRDINVLKNAVKETKRRVKGVEVLFQ
ncbi:hypothetical protein MEBOL_007438 [Melittangium boletus DSM 14713]|uniref:Uncharacterized protein n=1 Tax=Melittangium boletus DSM 14713 TaxID=1294270 RepID=A0A250IRX4_9BACT|nr:hypothetical protein MEBOL_007438 [Melittangium boletus DSM 14713]